ncbi:uncharacterized protein Dwil_GK19544, isoform D [Drosophila willistoni]|uniref:Uncharacterized protein, isoform D n=1 Tax=Drosophila willistoni TaxID=7260 RepID=A0A0Q9WPE6_DROWI|nr:uncharacterized protein LOC6639671 isoform X1 [Drosophila willistoni]KRF97818.1 uncharacterized protein Dwil_GK19544, isoform D [Drosophila willistoni]
MISALFSRLIILFFGTLYPAYASYKAVRTKNVKEYVKWMMYWIVFAFFTCIETFTDIFLSWFPFYYEVKVVIVLWLLSPATKGSSTLYRKFVHPMLTRREQEIDEYLNQAKERGYSAVLQLGSKGVNYATNVIMQTAIKGGGNLVQTIKRSYSLSDLSEPDMHRTQDELDDVMMSSSAVVMRPHASTSSSSSSTRLLRPRNQTPVGRSASGTRHSTGMYFTEVDVTAKNAGDYNYNIRSQDDISSGYSSAEPLSGLSRTSSMTNASKARLKSKRNEQLMLEEMRNEVYMENQLYYQELAKEKNKETNLDVAPQLIAHEEEDNFYEAESILVETKPQMEVLKEEEPEKTSNIDSTLQEEVNTNDSLAVPLIEIPKTKEILDTVEETKEPNQSVDKQALENSLNGSQKSLEGEECFEEALENISTNSQEALENIETETAKTTIVETPLNVDPFVLVVSTSSLDPTPPPRPVTPRDLMATLEEIKHSFREQLRPETTPSPRPRLAQHGKGRAPPPPLPPRAQSLTPSQQDTISVNSTASTPETGTPRKSGIGQLFKNIKANVLRSKSNPNEPDEQPQPLAMGKETQL